MEKPIVVSRGPSVTSVRNALHYLKKGPGLQDHRLRRHIGLFSQLVYVRDPGGLGLVDRAPVEVIRNLIICTIENTFGDEDVLVLSYAFGLTSDGDQLGENLEDRLTRLRPYMLRPLGKTQMGLRLSDLIDDLAAKLVNLRHDPCGRRPGLPNSSPSPSPGDDGEDLGESLYMVGLLLMKVGTALARDRAALRIMDSLPRANDLFRDEVKPEQRVEISIYLTQFAGGIVGYEFVSAALYYETLISRPGSWWDSSPPESRAMGVGAPMPMIPNIPTDGRDLAAEHGVNHDETNRNMIRSLFTRLRWADERDVWGQAVHSAVLSDHYRSAFRGTFDRVLL